MRNVTPRPDPPAHLTAEASSLWVRIVSEYDLDAAGLLVLEGMCESFARMREAQAALAADGITITDRFGQLKPHPCVNVERDAKQLVLKQLRSLGLDLEPLNDRPGRPSAKGGGY